MEGIRIGVLGNVDSAKTTTISVLKNNILDNGRGSARSLIFKHKHEQDTGRTSSINHTHVKHSEEKVISYVDLAGHEKYLKTTVFGLNACSIDYAVILVGVTTDIDHASILTTDGHHRSDDYVHRTNKAHRQRRHNFAHDFERVMGLKTAALEHYADGSS